MNSLILGIDPGSRITGYALLKSSEGVFTSPLCDVIRLDSSDDPLSKLLLLYETISRISEQYKPDSCAIETPVYGKDPLAMMTLGRAQSAIIMAILHRNIPLFEYYPKAIKKSITGNGNANKQQVAYMLNKLVDMPDGTFRHDATDALAVAWCHQQKSGSPESNHNPSTYEAKTGSRNRNTWEAYIKKHPVRVHKNK